MPPTLWERTKGGSKKGFDKTWQALDKLGDPVNRLSYRLGAEAFWPMTLDKECDKAARIMRSFCKDGFYADGEDYGGPDTTLDGKIDRPKGKQRVLQKIPAKVIQRALGLAIFTTMRSGLWFSGSGGAGVLLGREPATGDWSPPSGIMLHTAGVGFLAGVDIYDCVVVINTPEALEAFKTFRCTIGGEISASAGPVGVGGILESEVHKRQTPVWNYMKSRGFYAGVQVDGTVIIERTDENERFYGERISVVDILAGKVRHPPPEINGLLQTIKAAQGDSDIDETMLPPPGETPGDANLHHEGVFGIPSVDDPDPFGVKALEAEGLFIREAGSNSRPSLDAFEFKPNPSSPVYPTFAAARASASYDNSPRTSWRASVQSHVSVDRGTQTDDTPVTAPMSTSRASSRSRTALSDKVNRWDAVIPEHYQDHDQDQDQGQDLEDDLEVHEVSSATVSKRGSGIEDNRMSSLSENRRHSPTFTRARLVTIPKRIPPPLPPRHPQRILSVSTPVSPVSPVSPAPSSPDGSRSVASTSKATLSGFAELPRHYQSSSPSSISQEFTPLERDEFHSVSSDQSSDHESDKASSVESNTTHGVQNEEPHALTHDSKVDAPDQNQFVHAQTA